VAIDTFGNLITNLRRSYLEDLQPRRVCLSGVEIEGLVPTFGSRAPEELIALYDEDGYLMISVVNGNAQRRLGALAGDFVDVLTD
jgi:S-adenosylmethionine hydrolase